MRNFTIFTKLFKNFGYTIFSICDSHLITCNHQILIGCNTFLRATRASSRDKTAIKKVIILICKWSIDSGYGINIIFSQITVKPNFDTVPYLRVIEKLKGYNMSGKLLMWLKSFLSGRFQRVVLNRFQSQWSEVASGVPQRLVLGFYVTLPCYKQ